MSHTELSNSDTADNAKANNSSSELFAQAQEFLPGGVNSPVRAFGSVRRDPLFIDSADGCTITDVEGRTYIDYVASWGPMILGHNHPAVYKAVEEAIKHGLSFGAPCPAEVELARLICSMVPELEMVRMVNSGTEAVMSALRLARAATSRSKIIKFEGCYHGHSDGMLVKAGSGALTGGLPSSAGVSSSMAADTVVATYNDLASVELAFKTNPGEIAAVIVEPVAANMGVLLPAEGFLEGLRSLCDSNGSLLIFDEVITGFRLARGGAQERFGVRADLVTYGKIIGAGMPVGAYGGSRKLMEMIAPCGPVYQAGTLSGNPVAMAAGYAQLTVLNDDPSIYERINASAAKLAEGLKSALEGLAYVQSIGSLVCAFFNGGSPVSSYADVMSSDTSLFADFFNQMLDRGVYLAPSQFEAMFVGAAHDDQAIERTIKAAQDAKDAIKYPRQA